MVGVDKRFLTRIETVDCHAEAVGDHLHARGRPCRRGDDPVVMEIEDRRYVDLGAADLELGHVRGPLGVPDSCRELAVQHVVGCFADLTSEGVVPFATTHRALQPELAHQFEHGLLGHPPPLSEQDSEDTPVPIGVVRCLEHTTNGLFEIGLGVLAPEPAPMVVERRPGKVRDLQQER